MWYPNRRQEKKLSRQGFRLVCGCDEAGRGSWAGPLVAGAVILDPKKKIKGLKDSKLLRSPQRKALATEIKHLATAWAVGVVDHREVDQLGVQPANLLAISRAVANLSLAPEYVLVDGFVVTFESIPSQRIINGDHKVSCIAAASIIAKVARDEMMDQLDEHYPAYGFKHHKGYGTPHHYQMLMKYGVCEIHRTSFEPMKHLITG